MALPGFLFGLFQRHPRATAAAWFGLFALGAASAMFLVPALERGFADRFLYLLLPGLAGALAGSLSGWQLLTARGSRGWLRAAGRGVLVAVEAFVIFSLLFTLAYRWLGEQQPHPLVFFASTLAIGGLATGLVVLPTGALAGVLLDRLGRSSR